MSLGNASVIGGWEERIISVIETYEKGKEMYL